jgi:hypothetical protein
LPSASRGWTGCGLSKSRLEIPLANVVSAGSASAEARNWLHGIRVGGTHVPR